MLANSPFRALFIAIIIAGLVTPTEAQPKAAANKSAVIGQVISVDAAKNSVTIDPAGPVKQQTVQIAQGARLLLNGKIAKVADLKKGDAVRFAMSQSAPVAIEVRAARIMPGDKAKPADGSTPPAKPAPAYIAPGEVNPRVGMPAIGVSLSDSPGQGVLVVNVVPDSPADTAGIKSGDYLMIVGSRPVHTPRDVVGIVQRMGIGDPLAITRWRENKIQRLVVKPVREIFVPLRPVKGTFQPLTDRVLQSPPISIADPDAQSTPEIQPVNDPLSELQKQNAAIKAALEALQKEFTELKKRLE